MRTAYHDQLAALTAQLQMCARSGVAMERATQALLQADLVLAEQVITDHDQVTAMSARVEVKPRSCCSTASTGGRGPTRDRQLPTDHRRLWTAWTA